MWVEAKDLPSVVSLGVSTCLHPRCCRRRRLRRPGEVNVGLRCRRDESVGVWSQFSGRTGSVLRYFLSGPASSQWAAGH